MAVHLVRHGEHLATVEHRFGDVGLTPHGRGQARVLAKALADVPLRACLSSPLERAGETARIALEGRRVAHDVLSELAEGSLGELDGLSRTEALQRFPQDFRLGRGVVERLAASGRTAPGGESRAAFYARAQVASRRVEEELRRGGDVLVVAHGGLLNYLLQDLLRIPLRDEVLFGFEPCGGVAVEQTPSAAGYGPFPVLWFR